jgi:hypothetical protein
LAKQADKRRSGLMPSDEGGRLEEAQHTDDGISLLVTANELRDRKRRVERNVCPITRNGCDWDQAISVDIRIALTSSSPFSRKKGGHQPSTGQADC